MLVAGAVSAEVLEDFEPGTSYSGAGTIQVDPDDAGNHVLLLEGGEVATFIPLETAGTVTMKVYDFGEIPNFNGPRWGVADADESVAVAIIDKPWLEASTGYGMGLELSRDGDWWSPAFFGGPRQVDALDDPGTGGFEGDGKWTTWTFDVTADGGVAISSFTSQTYGTVDAMDTIWVSGGKGGDVAHGVLIDDISFSPASESSPLVLVDVDLQTLVALVGGTIDAIMDIDGDPGTQVALSIIFTNGLPDNGMHIGVPMEGTEAYEGQFWKIDVANTNAFPVFIHQKLILGDGSWTNGDASPAWVASGATNSFAMTVPAGGINNAMLMVMANSDWGGAVPVGGILTASVQIVGPTPPEKTPVQLYMDWAAPYGLTDTNTTAAMGHDVEPDGMDNLLEYALGGNPTNDDAVAVQPAATFLDSDTWEYVYKRYRDAADRQLTYDLQTKGDLVGESWVSSGGMYETGTNTTDSTFDVVTNTVTGLANEMFIKLEITENF
ncbi:MAG: hypothetical protein DRP64_00435 [Verrucomicrobia bacterium]|nr:MAG: hypothetical protein DRP64_00435 [Verrucomicrobiota bacterium]